MISLLLRIALVGFLIYWGMKLLGRVVKFLAGPGARRARMGERGGPVRPGHEAGAGRDGARASAGEEKGGFSFKREDVLDVPFREAPEAGPKGPGGAESAQGAGEAGLGRGKRGPENAAREGAQAGSSGSGRDAIR